MATYSAANAVHATLIANQVDTVTLTSSWSLVRVVNRSTSGPIYVRVDGVNPTVAGNEAYVVPNGEGVLFTPPDTSAIEVRLIAGQAAAYSVEGTL